MRVLRFQVTGQQTRKDPDCSFDGLVAGTSGYLKAHFTFSSEWENCVKLARFYIGEKEVAVKLVNDECIIPSEVLTKKTFRVGAIGQRGEYRITADTTIIYQKEW